MLIHQRFYSQIRGTAIGLAASFNRIMGVFAPIIAIYADLTTSAPYLFQEHYSFCRNLEFMLSI